MSVQTLTATTAFTNTTPRRVLVVDDSPAVAEAMQLMLVELGHDAEISTESRDALAKFKPGKYDLVITDYSMPGMNGIELAEIMRRRSAVQRIIMATAFAFTIAAYDGRPLPVDVVLRKPFHADEFQEAIVRLFPPSKHRH